MEATFFPEHDEIQIVATRKEILDLAARIESIDAEVEVALSGASFDGEGPRPLRTLAFCVAAGNAIFSLPEEGLLLVRGGRAALRFVAHHLRFLVENEANEDAARHLHLEHHDGHPFLSADSLPVTVYLADDAGSGS